MTDRQRYWLLKSEPTAYSIDDLERDRKTAWSGVRNYQARNFMTEMMQTGDTVLFYHSNSEDAGIYGMAEVVSKSYPDPTQYEPESPYFDARAAKDKPIWHMVDIAFRRKLAEPVLLAALRAHPELTSMTILSRGSRLSITRVTEAEFRAIHALAGGR